MRILAAYLTLYVLAFAAGGCNKQIQSFVGHGATTLPSIMPNLQTSNSIPIKISPSANTLAGSQVTTQFAVTPTQQTVTGTKVSSTFSFYQNRPQ